MGKGKSREAETRRCRCGREVVPPYEWCVNCFIAYHIGWGHGATAGIEANHVDPNDPYYKKYRDWIALHTDKGGKGK